MNEETLFHEALARPPAERAAFLDGACSGRPELRAAVEALLAAHEATGPFLDAPKGGTFFSDAGDRPARPSAPAGPGPRTPPSAPVPGIEAGTVVGGRYTLFERIGEGGMGDVWVARQTEPVKRKVALKLIKTGMDSRAVLARFEQERQALAMMDHPNIARVLDGGMTPTGQPFFVMELVNGLPLTRFCDEMKLTLRERLALFVPICQAVQHAHQKGIVHRDLKPANILVTLIDGKPVPKVIDFGVAKATGGKLTDESMFTHFGAIVGTLDYMAPEQAGFSGVDIDTRADIYSLGVILYELLTGLRPIDAKRMKEVALTEMIRIVQEEEPSKPSTRLSTDAQLPSLAAVRQTDPKKLMALLRGELDWVVMKCLEKRRDRRYETANALARDVERYLAAEPVEARPPSAGYRLGKFLQRHRGPVIAACVVLLALVGGVVAASWGLVRARRAEEVAVTEAREAERARLAEADQRTKAEAAERSATAERDRAVEAEADTEAFGDFLVDRVLAACRPQGLEEGIGFDVKMSEALEQAEKTLAADFAGRPRAEARARHALGVTWKMLGRYGPAEDHLRRALELRREELGPDHLDTLDAMTALAATLRATGRDGQARPMLEEALRLATARYGPDHRATLNCADALAMAHLHASELDRALPLLKEALERRKRAFGAEDAETLQGMYGLGRALLAAGDVAGALRLFEETVALQRIHLGPDHRDTMSTTNSLAAAYMAAGDVDRAPPLLEEVARRARVRYGPDHPTTLMALNNLGVLYTDLGQIERAQALLEETLPRLREKLGADHPNAVLCLNNLAALHQNAGRRDLARPLFEEALPLFRARLGPDHPDTIRCMNNLATCLDGDMRRARQLFEDAWSAYKRTLGPDHPDTLQTMINFGESLDSLREYDRALEVLEQALDLTRAKLGPDHPTALHTMADIARIHRRRGRVDLALPLLEQWYAATKAKHGPDHRDTLESANALAATYWSARRLGDSVPLLEDTLGRCQAVLGRAHYRTLLVQLNLGVNYRDSGRIDDAVSMFEEAFAIMAETPDAVFPDAMPAAAWLASYYASRKEHVKAVAPLEFMLRQTLKTKGPDDAETWMAKHSVAMACWHARKLDRSIPLFEELLVRNEARFGRDHRDTALAAGNLGVNLLEADRAAEAVPQLERAFAARERVPELAPLMDALLKAYTRTGAADKRRALVMDWLAEARERVPAESPQIAGALAQAGMFLLQWEEWTEAEPLLKECIAIREKTQPGTWALHNARAMLGGALLGQKRYAEAEPLLREGYRGMVEREAEIPPPGRPRLAEALERLVQLYEATGNESEAARRRDELTRRAREKGGAGGG